MQSIRRWSKSLLFIGLLLSIAACGRSANVVTKDDSAEYQSAQSLPPLKKPDRSDVLSGSTDGSQVSATEQSPPRTEAKSAKTQIAASEIDVGNNQIELEINAPLEQAWRFVRRNIGKSDLTVHTRNKAASRFSIGCSSLETDAEPQTTKKRGWSIFRRSKENGVHCALQLSATKESTRVQVLGRDGSPVAADSAREIFSRLLNKK